MRFVDMLLVKKCERYAYFKNFANIFKDKKSIYRNTEPRMVISSCLQKFECLPPSSTASEEQ